ncbi:hypothetical protein FNF07_03900 [Trinickia caryophylli]|nr:hypothetical protein C0Z17_13220 [Trinickia caryophylli]TRX17460.1 hypothetical protein FNF07_03900 [Trinickia caryophylli]
MGPPAAPDVDGEALVGQTSSSGVRLSETWVRGKPFAHWRRRTPHPPGCSGRGPSPGPACLPAKNRRTARPPAAHTRQYVSKASCSTARPVIPAASASISSTRAL